MADTVVIDGTIILDNHINGSPNVTVMAVVGDLVASESSGAVTLRVAGNLQQLSATDSNGTVTISMR